MNIPFFHKKKMEEEKKKKLAFSKKIITELLIFSFKFKLIFFEYSIFIFVQCIEYHIFPSKIQ